MAAAAKNVMGGNPGYGGPRKLVLKKESATPKSAQLPVRLGMQLIQAIGDAGAQAAWNLSVFLGKRGPAKFDGQWEEGSNANRDTGRYYDASTHSTGTQTQVWGIKKEE